MYMKSKRNNLDDHVDTHRWVISYADFITLLFAFFVVMYAISSVNISKYKSLSEGMKSAFDKKGHNHGAQPIDTVHPGKELAKTEGKYNDGMDELEKSLSDFKDGDYKIFRNEGWIQLEIKAGSLFNSGDADLKSDAVIKLMQLAGKIRALGYPIVIEGYTDSIPIETPQFPSNWELSSMRAAAVGRILNSYGIDSNRITVTGYGDQYPLADNLTEVGRSQNRRVNIIIAKNKNIDRLLNPGLGQVHDVLMGNSVTINQLDDAANQNSSSTVPSIDQSKAQDTATKVDEGKKQATDGKGTSTNQPQTKKTDANATDVKNVTNQDESIKGTR